MCCLQGECINRAWQGGCFLNQPRERQRWSGLGEERKLEEGSEKRRDTKQLQRSAFFIKTLMLLLKGASNISRATFLKCQQKTISVVQWFNDQQCCSIMEVHWAHMLWRKKKKHTKIQRKPKHNWTNYKNQRKCYLQKKKKILFKELFIIQVSKIKVIIQCLLSNI